MPPSKRLNSTAENESEIASELEEFTKKVENNEQIELAEYLRNIFLVTKDVKDNQSDLKLKVKKLETDSEATISEVKNIKQSVVKLEFENVSNSAIIRNLAMHPNAINRSEKFEESFEIVSNFLKAMKIDNEICLIEASRFSPSKKPGNSNIPPIKATFRNKSDTVTLFKSLNKLQGTNFSAVNVAKVIPDSLMKKNQILEKAAYQIRQAEKGAKTKVFTKNFDLVLMKKSVGDTD